VHTAGKQRHQRPGNEGTLAPAALTGNRNTPLIHARIELRPRSRAVKPGPSGRLDTLVAAADRTGTAISVDPREDRESPVAPPRPHSDKQIVAGGLPTGNNPIG